MLKAELIEVIEDLYPLALCHAVEYAYNRGYGKGKVHPTHMKIISDAQHVIENKKEIKETK